MTDDMKLAIYAVLVSDAGAQDTDSMHEQFMTNWPECNEFRFCGNLGFGGKVWAAKHGEPVRVTCYPEDRNAIRDEIVTRTNLALAELCNDTRAKGGEK